MMCSREQKQRNKLVTYILRLLQHRELQQGKALRLLTMQNFASLLATTTNDNRSS